MTRIKILPESVKNKIAAGEVVEGPFSVVKELMENSIDAKATEIDIDVYESGLKKILIKDNGTGIYKDDLPLAIQNHATSKITDIADIERIRSYGFRGEALASISSISKLTILSRSAYEDMGAKLICANGHTEITDYAGAQGTTIIVENLFYNIPARKKFLGAKSTELRRLREIFLKIALANPGIGCSFNADDKRIFTLTRVSKPEDRIEQIYGKSVTDGLDFNSLRDQKAEISGFLSKPDFLKSSRSLQIIYVNGRLVDYKYLGFFLSKAYEAVASKGSHPAAIIFLNIDPELIDVNIHPAKKEIKFWDQNYINSLIVSLAAKALGKVHSLDIGRLADRHTEKYQKENDSPGFHGANFFKPYASQIQKPDFSFKSVIRDSEKIYNEIENQYDFKYLGIVFDTYILIEKDDTLSFIDFHAAHERYIFDTIESSQPETQNLIFPQVIELSIEEYQIFLEKKEYFIHAAFDIDIFSDNSIVVRGIPGIANNLDIEKFILDCMASFKHNGDRVEDIKKTIAEKTACYSAKRSGDSLTVEDAKLIASRALSGNHELRCPHGRPYIYKLEKNDLEKVFKRI